MKDIETLNSFLALNRTLVAPPSVLFSTQEQSILICEIWELVLSGVHTPKGAETEMKKGHLHHMEVIVSNSSSDTFLLRFLEQLLGRKALWGATRAEFETHLGLTEPHLSYE